MQYSKRIIPLVFILLASFSSLASAQSTARVLLIGGQNNHDWKRTTPYLNHVIGSHEQIECTINNTPSRGGSTAWATWDPKFTDFDVVVLNYNGASWPDSIKTRFVDYIRGGGSAILIHAANNSFTGWDEYEEMVGLLWRSPDYGQSIYFKESGQQVRLAPGEGGGMGHGGVYDWVMTTRDADNPVTKGLPRHWMHANDELYHGQRGPAKNLNILLSAYSDPKHGGTGRHEPIVWWIPYGRGKVITNVMGHVWGGGDLDCLQCVGFQTVLHRSVLWLAGIEVNTKLPDAFPIADQTSLVEITPEVLSSIEESQFKRLNRVLTPREGGSQGLVQGLKYSVYDGNWNRMPEFESLTPAASGVTEALSLNVTSKSDNYAIRYSGYLQVRESGDYSFYTKSDDGSKLLIDGVDVVDNDGIHGEQEEACRVALVAGVYPFEVQFFEASGGEALHVMYAGPDSKKQPIPTDSLFHQP